jgi:hypothetical protein
MLYTNLRDATGQPVSVRCAGGKIAEICRALRTWTAADVF